MNSDLRSSIPHLSIFSKQINFIFALTALHNFIKDHFLQNINFFEGDGVESATPSNLSKSLFSKYLVTSIQINQKKIQLQMLFGKTILYIEFLKPE